MGKVLTYEEYRKLSDEGQDLHDKKQMEKIRYKIEILDSASFDKLPYKKTKESLGIALPEKGLAYVRKTGDKAEDLDTFLHELEELELAESWHEEIEDGVPVRYKSFWKKVGDIFKNYVAPIALALVPGVGPALSAIYTGINSYQTTGNLGSSILAGGIAGVGGMLGQSNVGYQAGVAGSKAAGGGIIGQTLSGGKGLVGNLLGMTPATTTGATPIAGLEGPVTQAQSQLGYNYLSQVPANLVGSAAANAALLGNVGKVGTTPTIPSMSQPTTPAASTVAPTAGQVVPSTTTTAGKTLLEQAKGLVTPQNILGAGSLLASTMGTTPQYQMPSSFTDLQSKLMEGQALTPLGQQAQMELSNILKSTPQELIPTESDAYYQAALRRTRESYAEAQKSLDAAYNVAGVYGSGEHLAAKDKLQQQLTNAEADLYAQTESANQKLAITEKYQAIQTALGVDQNVMNDLLGLSGLDVQVASAMYNADVNDVTELRKALGTLGSELLVRGTTGQGIKSTGGININLAK